MGGNFYNFFFDAVSSLLMQNYKSTFFKKHTARYQILCPLEGEGIRNLNITEKVTAHFSDSCPLDGEGIRNLNVTEKSYRPFFRFMSIGW